MRYFRKIVGDRLYLSPINTGDASVYTMWLNDEAVAGNLGNFWRVIGLDGEQKALERMANEGQNYAMVLKDGDKLIGNISLMDVKHVHRTATLGIFIGEAEYRGNGYGAEAIRLILEFGFNTLNLHNIMLQVHSDNAPAIACYKKVGFRECGRRHEARYKNGHYIDVIDMEILDYDFVKGGIK